MRITTKFGAVNYHDDVTGFEKQLNDSYRNVRPSGPSAPYIIKNMFL